MVSTQANSDAEARGGLLALLRYRNYALLWTGQLVSQVGDRFHWVAISLWVYAQTGSALSVSYAIMALMVAPAFVGFWAGALVDRLDRRRIMVAADLVRAGLVAAIPWLMEHGIVWVYLDLFLISAASAFFRPAMFAAIPQSVPEGRLLQANAFFASMDSATEVFGPALAGLLVASVGYAMALYVDAATFVVSAVFVNALRLGQGPVGGDPATRPAAGSGVSAADRQAGILRSIREGLRYIRGDRVQVALLAYLIGGFWVAGLSSLQTPLAKGVLGINDSQFGWFQSIWGIGFIAASLLLAWYGGRLPRGQAIVLGYFMWALAAAVMGLSPNYGVLVVTGFWVGFANMLVFVNVSTVMMEHTPSRVIGRVVTTRQILVALMRAAALLGFGALGDLVGIRAAILAMAGISAVGTAVAAMRSPVLWWYRVPDLARVRDAGLRAADAAGGLGGIGAPFSALARVLLDRADPEFDPAEQRWLNLATLLIVAVGWLVLLVQLPIEALGVAAVAAGAAGVAYAARLVGRLRASAGGHDHDADRQAP